jgi:hypothetical protein
LQPNISWKNIISRNVLATKINPRKRALGKVYPKSWPPAPFPQETENLHRRFCLAPEAGHTWLLAFVSDESERFNMREKLRFQCHLKYCGSFHLK